jgi:hypothetical protein
LTLFHGLGEHFGRQPQAIRFHLHKGHMEVSADAKSGTKGREAIKTQQADFEPRPEGVSASVVPIPDSKK